MRIVLSGVETNNKGAELMLYAILQEIEKKYPEAEVIIDENRVKQGRRYVDTSVNLILRKIPEYIAIMYRLRINGLVRRLFNYSFVDVVKDADFFIDGSGLHFSDNMIGERFNADNIWRILLRGYHKRGTKIVFLPQAFGPITKPIVKSAVQSVSKYSSLVFARERKSYDYLRDSGLMNMDKVRICTDFTISVKGIRPQKYEYLDGSVCLIPNLQMVRKGILSHDDYVAWLTNVMKLCYDHGNQVYLLNHEGPDDERLAYECARNAGFEVEVVSGLNAIETKGMISRAYLVISSRFHGVASALNSYVPCLATSWSHKYQCLFEDFGIVDSILDVNNLDRTEEKIIQYLDPVNNKKIVNDLKKASPGIRNQIADMWEEVWSR